MILQQAVHCSLACGRHCQAASQRRSCGVLVCDGRGTGWEEGARL